MTTAYRTLESKGSSVSEPITAEGFGLTATLERPGGVPVTLYEPKHDQP